MAGFVRRYRHLFARLALILLYCLLGCTTNARPDRTKAATNPLGGELIFPFPSDYYTSPDATSATGLRLNISAGDLPELFWQSAGQGFEGILARLNRTDGFSPTTPLVIELPPGFNEAALPDAKHSAAAGSPLLLLDCEQMKAVPYRTFIDRDGLAEQTPRKLLVIQPLFPLTFGVTYTVVLRSALNDNPAEPLFPAYRHLIEGQAGGERIERLRGQIKHAADKLDRLGIGRQEQELVFRFTVRSREQLQGPMAAVRRIVEEHASELPVEIDFSGSILSLLSDSIALDVFGHFEVYDFRDEDHFLRETLPQKAPEGRDEVRFLLQLPKTAADKPAPIVIFGHGLGAMKESQVQISGALARAGFAVIGIDVPFHGLTSPSADLLKMMSFRNLPLLPACLYQAAANNLQLVEQLKGELGKIDLLPEGGDGRPDLDPQRIFYIGQSFGGIYGPVAAAFAPEIEAAVFNVSGGNVLSISFESALFDAIKIGSFAPPGANAAEKLAIVQMLLPAIDPVEPLSYSSLITGAMGKKRPVLVQSAVGDGIVPNFAQEQMARALGLCIEPPVQQSAPGLAVCSGDAEGGALVQYPALSPYLAHISLLFSEPQRERIVSFFVDALNGDRSAGAR